MKRPKNADLIADFIADSNADSFINIKCQQKKNETQTYQYFWAPSRCKTIKLSFFSFSADSKAMEMRIQIRIYFM